MQLKECGDIRVYILTIMANIGTHLSYPDINDIIVQDEFVSNFDFIEQFAYLADKGFVKIDNEGKYYVTKQGAFIEDALKSNIYGYIRERGLYNAIKYLSFKDRNIKIRYSEDEQPDGSYNLTCRMIQNKKDIMTVTVNAETKFQTTRMAQNFVENPDHLYKLVCSFLIGDLKYPTY